MKENRIALFIDGGYLDNVLLHFGKARIDYSKLAEYMRGDKELLRAYYYHCLPYQSSNPTEEEREEFSRMEAFFRRLNRIDSFLVRQGKLAYRGTDDKGRPVFEQKHIDVYLATDLVMHSTKHLITHAALLTGDSDFLPAIEIAQSEGVNITLFYEPNVKAHDELLDAVDNRIVLTNDLINSWKR